MLNKIKLFLAFYADPESPSVRLTGSRACVNCRQLSRSAVPSARQTLSVNNSKGFDIAVVRCKVDYDTFNSPV